MGKGNVTISELADINPRVDLTSLSPTSIVSFIPMADVSEKGIWWHRQERMLKDVRAGFTPFAEDDLLFAKITPCMENGKGAHVSKLKNRVGFGSTEFHVLRAKSDNSSRFLFHWLQAQPTRTRALAFMGGSAGQQRVQAEFFQHYKVPFIEPPDQVRIAYVLDQIDESIQKTEIVIAKLKQIRTGMLHDLLTYGLDKDGKLRDPVAHSEQFKDSELGRIPREWEVFSLKDIGQIVSGGTPSRANLSYWNGDIPWITPTDMTALRGDYIAGGAEYLSKQGLMSSAAGLLPVGAVVVSSRATLGLAAVVSKPLATNQGFKNIIPHKEWNSVLICHIVRKLKKRMVQQASGTTFLEISAAEFGRLKFVAPYPGSDEQATIVERIESVDCAITSFSETHAKLFSLKSGLMDDLLSGVVPVLENIKENEEALNG